MLAIVLATAGPAQADAMMEALVRWNPGAASWVIAETASAGLTRSLPSLGPEDAASVGKRLRAAMAAWLEGLGPLANAFWPYHHWGLSNFTEVTVSVGIDNRLRVWWLRRDADSHSLPLIVDEKSLKQVLFGRGHKMVTFDIPTAQNGIWGVTRDYLVSDLTENFTGIVLDLGRKHPGVVRDETRVLEAGMRAMQAAPMGFSGNLNVERLYPAADLEVSDEHPVGGYTTQMMHQYAVLVLEAAMRCYIELASWITPRFGKTLGLLGLMPVEFYGDMSYKPRAENPKIFSQPGFSWLFRPLGPTIEVSGSGGNRVSLTVNDEERDREISDDHDSLYTTFRRYVEANPVYEPFASSFATHHGGVRIFDRMPATLLAINWLWDDLKELGFLDGVPPQRL